MTSTLASTAVVKFFADPARPSYKLQYMYVCDVQFKAQNTGCDKVSTMEKDV